MTRLSAIASKQVQLQELVACIRHFSVDEVSLHLFNHQKRIGLEGVRATLDEACPDLQLNLSTFDIDDKKAIAAIFDEPADVVAFPLYRSSAFYRRVPGLRRQRRTIVHVTDGVGDLFTMWELQRAVIAKTPAALIKGTLVLPQLLALRADLEFNIFHPRKTPYAKRSLDAGSFPMTAAKRRSLDALFKTHRPAALVIDGFDLTAERIARDLGLESYVATRRDGGIELNGRSHLANDVICAEEVLTVTRPPLVVGCPSSSLAAARQLHQDLPVFCITTPEALRIRGSRFNIVFRAYAERFGILFSDAGDVASQLLDFRRRIPDEGRACA